MAVINLILSDTVTLSDGNLNKELEHIKFARTMEIDGNGVLWVATYTDPTKLIKISNIGGDYEIRQWTIW